MNLSEMRRWLDACGIKLTKSLGQNFLHDGNQLRRIAAAGELRPTDKVLEVGPGLGPLTELLVEQAGEVLAIEMDARLLEILRGGFPPSRAGVSPAPNSAAALLPEKNTPAARLTLIHADALRWLRDPANARDWSAWKLVANLPYSVASPLLVELAEADGPPERMVVTLQLEVAQRIAAEAGSDSYGLLSLLLQLRYEPRGWFKIPGSCFFPAPDVDSACLTLVRRPRPLLTPAEAKAFTRLVKLAFSQRRKMMLKLLKTQWPEDRLQAALVDVGVAPTARGETVGLDQFVALTKHLHQP